VFRGFFKGNGIALLIIFMAVFLLYGNTIRNGYNLDDTYVAQDNPRVMKGLAGIPEIFTSRYVDEEGNSFGYRPMAMATFAIEQELWGQNPRMGHLVNTMLFALCAMLLYLVIRKIFHDTSRFFAMAVALLFIAHPIHTEVVASLKNRETLLSFMFSLAALLSFLKWLDTRRTGLVIAGLLSFLLAFLSKQDAVTFAAVIPMAMFFYSKENHLIKHSKGNINVSFIKNDIKSLSGKKIYIILAIIFFVIFTLVNFFAGSPLLSTFTFSATLLFMIVHYVKNKPLIKSSHNHVIGLFFLSIGILVHLILAINLIRPGYYYKSYLPIISLVCYAIFFFRIFENSKIVKVQVSLKNPEILIPRIWLNLMMALAVLGIAGILIYKLPNLYLPAEDKVVYHFENPQFAQAPGYSTGPLAFYTLFFYLQKLAWPHPLGFYYGYKMIPEVGWGSPEVIFSMVFHLAILAFALWKLSKKHILSFAVLYYFITISVFTNIVIQIPGIVGERMTFFPSAGFCIALAWLIFKALKIGIGVEKVPKLLTFALAGIMLLVLVPYSAKTITRNRDWKDYLTLFSRDIGYLANSAKANNTYASQLLKEAYNNDVRNPSPGVQQQYLELAVKHLEKTTEIDPGYKFAWNNLGYITFQYLEEREKGIMYLEKAIALDSNYESARFNLAYALKLEERYDESLAQYREAVRVNPGNSLYYSEIADVYFRSGNPDSAIQWNRKAAHLNPLSDIPYINMGNIYWLDHDTLNAIACWEKAFELNPANQDVGGVLREFYKTNLDTKSDYNENAINKID